MAELKVPEELAAWAKTQVCPGCRHYGLDVSMRATYKAKGTYSLAGNQEKVVVAITPWLTCSECGLEAKGEATS